jgi:hypothetical protein
MFKYIVDFAGDDKFFIGSDYPYAEGFVHPMAKARTAWDSGGQCCAGVWLVECCRSSLSVGSSGRRDQIKLQDEAFSC